MTVTAKGVVKDYSIRETVIRSKRRFTYEDVQAIIDSPGHGVKERLSGPGPGDVPSSVRWLTKKRMKEGSIDFESAEAKFEFDAEGKPSAIIKKIRLESHRLVEEFMLLANKVVAGHSGLAKKEEHQKPFLPHPRFTRPGENSGTFLFSGKVWLHAHVDGRCDDESAAETSQ